MLDPSAPSLSLIPLVDDHAKDGGVYFSTLSPSSYNLGAKGYEDNVIIDW
jgi:hypothetical protein